MEELRVVARYVAETAQEVLPVFEDANPGDTRPRAAIDAAWEFINGAPRTKLQRVTSLDAHRAAKETATETARLAAQAAGDAASAAYLHPIAKAHQVGHILRAAANCGTHRRNRRRRGSQGREQGDPRGPRTSHTGPDRYPPAVPSRAHR
ncbi:putative immunity protein [Streptomyces ochraceiscleroticus]|uniref:Immunity protein n=1 Tax=Streptomyces ochraceiscleroticus TaxID=47761 RepID=A0ABW1ML79_9ACTN